MKAWGARCERSAGLAQGASFRMEAVKHVLPGLMGQRGAGFGVSMREVRRKAKAFLAPSFKIPAVTPIPC